jgi:hypothetical protein
MDTTDVPPLLPDEGCELARRLLEGEGIQANDLPATARAVATAVDGIPFFIQHVVDQLVGQTATPATVQAVVEASLVDPQDRWHLRYYQERLDIYYSQDERPFALAMLDVLCVVEEPITLDGLFERLKARLPTEDLERTRQVLTLLQRDHYVARQPDGRYGFRLPLIRRAWRVHRDL